MVNKTVYLTSRRFDAPSYSFKRALAEELRNRKIEVIEDYTQDLFNVLTKKHKTYGIAIGIDFYRDGKKGRGLTLNKNCSFISRDFAYNLSNGLDVLIPAIFWRDLNFTTSDDKTWYKFFNKVSSSTKAIFYLCTLNSAPEWETYNILKAEMVRVFADEVVRCLRSEYNPEDYTKRVKAAKLKTQKINNGKNAG